MSGKKLVCFHLFNDYSGSPKVLKMVLEGMLRKGYRIDLVSSKGGVLDELLSYETCISTHILIAFPIIRR